MALCRAWITNNTDIDVTTQVRSFLRDFMNATEQHQQNSTFHLIITYVQTISNDISSAVFRQTQQLAYCHTGQ